MAATILRQPKRVIKPTESLLKSGLIDSFSLIDVQAFIEDKFGVWVDDSDMTSGWDTLTELTALVASKKQ